MRSKVHPGEGMNMKKVRRAEGSLDQTIGYDDAFHASRCTCCLLPLPAAYLVSPFASQH